MVGSQSGLNGASGCGLIWIQIAFSDRSASQRPVRRSVLVLRRALVVLLHLALVAQRDLRLRAVVVHDVSEARPRALRNGDRGSVGGFHFGDAHEHAEVVLADVEVELLVLRSEVLTFRQLLLRRCAAEVGWRSSGERRERERDD